MAVEGPRRIVEGEAGFEAALGALVSARSRPIEDVTDIVSEIVASVRARGDAALVDYTGRFDRITLTPETLRIPQAEIDAIGADVAAETQAALALAARRIEAYHRRQRPRDDGFTDEAGVELGARWTAISSVGLYVPGGRASYPSSVLMNAIPARVAGVGRIAMVMPTPEGKLSSEVFAAARLAGIDEIYRVGGAQAVAALAYGTATIAPVDKIIGPGNAYVAEAKRQVFGRVGIDLIAGPSEILVVADAENDPSWIAADLLAQAEHDPAAQAILVTDDPAFAGRVSDAVARELSALPPGSVAGASWARHGVVIVLESLAHAAALVDRLAPEHVALAVTDPDALAARIRHAGAIFLGRYTPEAVGDYVAGTNHVLPTSGAARFASGLSVLDFMKRTSLLRLTAESLRRIGPAAVTLARAEGLAAHGRSVQIRLDRPRSG